MIVALTRQLYLPDGKLQLLYAPGARATEQNCKTRRAFLLETALEIADQQANNSRYRGSKQKKGWRRSKGVSIPAKDILNTYDSTEPARTQN